MIEPILQYLVEYLCEILKSFAGPVFDLVDYISIRLQSHSLVLMEILMTLEALVQKFHLHISKVSECQNDHEQFT